MAVLVGQVVAEVAHEPESAARVGQVFVEVAHAADDADILARVGQLVTEVIHVTENANILARVGQVYIEVVYSPGSGPVLPPNEELTEMPKLTADRVTTHRHRRFFIQFGGGKPNNPLVYSGLETQHIVLQGVSIPELGGIDPIYVRDPIRTNGYQVVNRSQTPPDLPTFSMIVREDHAAIPFPLSSLRCGMNVYEVVGNCKDLSDFLNGWTDFVVVYSNALVSDKDAGDRSSFDSDDAIEYSLSLTASAIYAVGGLVFGEKGASNIDREVLDVVYGTQIQCGECGIQDDGTNWIYAITKSSGAGSPGLPAELIYTIDGGLTFNEASITGIGATEDPIAIDIVGDKLVILSRTAGSATLSGYYYATINLATGVPGTWTKVTNGFVANKQANDIYVASPREIFFCADGGYIYRSSDIQVGVSVYSDGAATTNNLYRIHGKDDIIVSVGAGSTVVRSINRGFTFATVATSPAGTPLDITAVGVLDANLFWVGTSNSGRLYYTLNGGETWTESMFSGTGAGNIHDIVIATDDVIYFSYSDNTPTARIYRSWNGGNSFSNSSPALLTLPTFDRATRLAVPYRADAPIAANNLAVAGLGANGTDGILLLGTARIR